MAPEDQGSFFFLNFIIISPNFITIICRIFLPLLRSMKKILAILFSVFYFGFSSGAVFSMHYCMKELVSVTQKSDDTCSKCGTKEKRDCCKTEVKLVKVDDSQKSDFLKIDFLQIISEIKNHHFFLTDRSFSAIKFTQIQINAPPQNRSVPIFINHCNFRI